MLRGRRCPEYEVHLPALPYLHMHGMWWRSKTWFLWLYVSQFLKSGHSTSKHVLLKKYMLQAHVSPTCCPGRVALERYSVDSTRPHHRKSGKYIHSVFHLDSRTFLGILTRIRVWAFNQVDSCRSWEKARMPPAIWVLFQAGNGAGSLPQAIFDVLTEYRGLSWRWVSSEAPEPSGNSSSVADGPSSSFYNKLLNSIFLSPPPKKRL